MPDRRRHRGPHPRDSELFDAAQHGRLRRAVRDLSWLLSGGYSVVASLKLVGDRYGLRQRQRVAVMRAACSDAARATRRTREVPPAALAGRPLWIDGYNVLTTVEVALAGGVLLACRDGCWRDVASLHGTFRKVEETPPALEALGTALTELGAAPCRWLFDRAVSNSGRLKLLMAALAHTRGFHWEIETVPDPDPILARSQEIVATADSVVLDAGPAWFNLARHAVARCVPDAPFVDLGEQGDAR